MTIALTPATPGVVTEDQIRMFLRDYALGHLPGNQGNILLNDIQFSTEELTFATTMAVSAYNALTPITNYLVENFPNAYVLLLGTCRFLMMSEQFHQVRNQVSVQDGDIAPTGIYEKLQSYMALAQQLTAEWQMLARNIKTQLNMEAGYGFFGSGYRHLGNRRFGF
jgi:hypothetical protein